MGAEITLPQQISYLDALLENEFALRTSTAVILREIRKSLVDYEKLQEDKRD